MDKWGNMVAYTTTIEQVFGSGIMVPDYGFMLNNEMTDFDATPGGVNQVEPGKRPRSSMSPDLRIKRWKSLHGHWFSRRSDDNRIGI
ncbi:gamma-glutamyltransferase [Peribacillus frigoritolerans]|nr:gamma-glutamyltransferase [Peribacillus frigoritolerans]